MKSLAGMAALVGLCFLAQTCNAQGNTFCEGFLRSGDRTDLLVCIQHLDRQAWIVEQERDYELAGISMSNRDLTKSVKDLHTSLNDIQQKVGGTNPYEVPDLKLLTNDLQDRVQDLEKHLNAQGTLLDTQSQQIESLKKQLDAMRAERASKPPVHFQTKGQRTATTSKALRPTHPPQPNNSVKNPTSPQ